MKLLIFLLFFSFPLFADTPEHEALASFTQSSNQFGFQLYKSLSKTGENFLISPLSVESALTLARLGANGDTAKQMSTALKLSNDVEKIQLGFWNLMKHLNGEKGEKRGFELNSANALWIQIDFPIIPNYLSVAQKTFFADVKSVDFRKNTEDARKEINRWISDKTVNKIPEMIAPGVLSAANRMVITNAVYFKGEWVEHFEPKLTRDEKFYLKKRETKNVPMMNLGSQFNFLESDGAQLLELPYKRSPLSMLLIIPKEVEGLKKLESKITFDLYQRWMQKTQLKRVNLYLPRFKYSANYELEKPLKELGMKLPFDPEADFSGITKAEKIFIDSVAHKTFISVDEAGTEAAAATAALFKSSGAFPTEKPVLIRADRPFLYFIRDTDSGAILFMGKVNDPG